MTNSTLAPSQIKALEQIKALCADHDLSLDHVKSALRDVPSLESTSDIKQEKSGLLTAMLGYLGGTLVVAGFFFYATIVWDDLGSMGRVLLSLGTGLLCFFIGAKLQTNRDYTRAAPFLWTLSFLLIPTGLFVFLKEYVQGDDAIMGGVIVFGVSAVMFWLMWLKTQTRSLFIYTLFFLMAFAGTLYEKLGINTPEMWLVTGASLLLAGYSIYKKGNEWGFGQIMSIGTIALTSSAYYFLGNTNYDVLMTSIMLALVFAAYTMGSRQFVITSVIIFIGLAGKHYGFSAGYRDNDILRLTAAVTGLSMGLMGHWLSVNTINKFFPSLWYFFGSTLFFSAVMGLLYETPYDILFVIFPSITLYISLQLRSRALLASSLLSILSFISYYTFKYFADTAGWPLAMMVAGLIFIALGGFAMKMNKRISTT